jgi:hypothetical protein
MGRIDMDNLERLYQDYSESAAKAQEHYHAKDELMPKAREVVPGQKIEGWLITEEKLQEINRLEGLYEEEEKKQLEIMDKIARLIKHKPST